MSYELSFKIIQILLKQHFFYHPGGTELVLDKLE